MDADEAKLAIVRLSLLLFVGCVACSSERDLARDGDVGVIRYSPFLHRPYTSLVFKDHRVGGFGVACESAAAAIRSDLAQHRFAFRCDPSGAWQLFYVSPRSGWIFPTRVTLGDAAKPSFDVAKPLSEAAPDLVYVGDATTRRRIFETFEALGDGALLAWLSEPLAMDELCWDEFVAKLTHDSRNKLREVAKRELKKPSLDTYVRQRLEALVKSGA